MATRAIVKMGNTLLATPSTPVTDFNPTTQFYTGFAELIQNMKDTMEARNGVGITAPQIGCNKRIIMLGFDKSKRYPNDWTLDCNDQIKNKDVILC